LGRVTQEVGSNVRGTLFHAPEFIDHEKSIINPYPFLLEKNRHSIFEKDEKGYKQKDRGKQ
jgi:hypothetical protein